jgi:hypothetical protein
VPSSSRTTRAAGRLLSPEGGHCCHQRDPLHCHEQMLQTPRLPVDRQKRCTLIWQDVRSPRQWERRFCWPRWLVDAWQKGIAWSDVPAMIAAQVIGAFRRRGHRPPNVRRIAVLAVAAGSKRRRTGVQRVRRDIWAAGGDFGDAFGGVRPRRHLPWVPTSRRPTGSRPRHRSGILPSLWLVHLPARSPAFGRWTLRCSSLLRSPAPLWLTAALPAVSDRVVVPHRKRATMPSREKSDEDRDY